jgi:hypothetical protein
MTSPAELADLLQACLPYLDPDDGRPAVAMGLHLMEQHGHAPRAAELRRDMAELHGMIRAALIAAGRLPPAHTKEG